MKMRIKKLKISGFRGFTVERPIDLSQPVTILYGDNAQGKSSVLNAIEWCLFGSECAGKDTKMRERIGWKPENTLGSAPCKVTMTCQHPDGEVVFERVPKAGNRGLTVSLNRQTICRDEEANSWVENNVGDFTQFIATVYQHQENIRHLAIAEDRVKRDIINRLLGLSDYNNLLDSLQSTGYSTLSSKATDVRDAIDGIIDQRIFGYNDQNKGLSQDLNLEAKVISQRVIKIEAGKLTKSIESLHSGTGEKLGAKTNLEDFGDAHEYVRQMRDAARALLVKSPKSKGNITVGKRISDLDHYITRLKESAKMRSKGLDKVNEFEIQHGKLSSLQGKVNSLEQAKTSKEGEIARLNAIYSVLSSLYNYLVQNKLGIGKQECLACGSTANNQRDFLKQKVKNLESDTIKKANKELEGICANIEAVNKDLNELKRLQHLLESADETYKNDLKEAQSELKLTTKPGEDPVRVLNKLRTDLVRQRRALQRALEHLSDEVSKIEESCDRLDKIATVLDNKTSIQRLSSVKQHKAYKELMKLEGEAELFSSDIKAVVNAIMLVRDKEGKARVDGSKMKVREYFNMVAENPGIKGLEMILEPSRGYENFKFRDASGNDVITILSQGDLNVLALSIFAGLGEVNLKNIPFQSIIFDDPSQSMGLHHKKKLAELANIIASNRQVIISTMDSEFRHLLEEQITRPVKLIEFYRWDPDNGPKLK